MSRQRALATDGASTIPLDDITQRVVAWSGRSFDDVLLAGERLAVRHTANVHTGGTIDDVTAELHPALADASVAAARAIGIPVVGMDLIVAAPSEPDDVIIQANEQPGLANHEPQPTVQRFVDLLFPRRARPVIEGHVTLRSFTNQFATRVPGWRRPYESTGSGDPPDARGRP